ncbi:hypothetical protein HY450_03760 [Candidatus Pacearchaeota archaeon]|nr:hypothetical protein [Candidatus Pacearchaeota archaeon]
MSSHYISFKNAEHDIHLRKAKRNALLKGEMMRLIEKQVTPILITSFPILDNNGNFVDNLKDEDNRAIEIFKKELIKTGKQIALRYLERVMNVARDFSPHDFKYLEEICDNRAHSIQRKKSSRIKRFSELIGMVKKETISLGTLYSIISPLTFCFVPFKSEDRSSLEKKVCQLLDTNSYTPSRRGGELESPKVLIYSSSGHNADITCYIHTTYPRLKIKLFSSRWMNDIRDKLDVEAQFVNQAFDGIVHYHVAKPYTLRKFFNEDLNSYKNDAEVEITRHPRTGNIVMRGNKKTSDERIFLHEDCARDTFFDLRWWSKNPVVAGGNLFETLIDVVKQNPKFEALQHWAMRQ